MRRAHRAGQLVGLAAALLLAASARGQQPGAALAGASEPLGRVASLPSIGRHAVWVPDVVLGHSLLFDGDTGEMLGTIDTGATLSPKPPLYDEERGEFYSVDIAYSRGRRGDRIDYVSIYDATHLDVVGEVMLPTRTSESAASLAYDALLDGGRFLATFNQFPATSVSIVDLEKRRFVEEIVTSGCAGIYPTGPLSFAMLCGDGSMLAVQLDERGAKRSLHPTARFFDVLEDPVMMAGGRIGSRWLFVSYAGQVYEIDFGDAAAPAISSWWLSTEAQRSQGWRPGGRQHVAVHEASGRLYVLFHQGGPGSHKDPGPEVWVFDVSTRTRVDRFEMPNFTATFLGDTLGLEEGGVLRLLLDAVLPDEGADTIAVTRDPAPLLFARNSRLGSVAVLDARSGEHLRDLTEVGLAGMRLEVPR